MRQFIFDEVRRTLLRDAGICIPRLRAALAESTSPAAESMIDAKKLADLVVVVESLAGPGMREESLGDPEPYSPPIG